MKSPENFASFLLYNLIFSSAILSVSGEEKNSLDVKYQGSVLQLLFRLIKIH